MVFVRRDALSTAAALERTMKGRGGNMTVGMLVELLLVVSSDVSFDFQADTSEEAEQLSKTKTVKIPTVI